jgi:S-DNA-T family DNA segregation ATPase FtsK/SpoIIIE
VVITALRWTEIRASVLDSFGGRVELRMNAPADSVVDRRMAAGIRPDQPGRGLHPSRRFVQFALPRLDGVAGTDDLQAATKIAVEHVASRWEGPVAPPVRLLPSRVPEEALPSAGADSPPGAAVGLVEQDLATWWLDMGAGEPHFSVFGDGESGKTTFLRTWLRSLTRRYGPDQVRVALIDYRRSLLEVVPDSHLIGYAPSEPAARHVVEEVVAMLAARQPSASVSAAELRARSWWSGPDVYVVVDDYDLMVTPAGTPMAALVPHLAQGRDLGLHVVAARRVAGSAKAGFEPLMSRLREVSPSGLLLSGDRNEGPLLGGVRATEQPPGRGILVGRRSAPSLVQVADSRP